MASLAVVNAEVAAGGPVRPPPAEQLAIISRLSPDVFDPDLHTVYFPVPADFYRAWKSLCEGNEATYVPATIKSVDLASQLYPQILKRGLIEDTDVTWLPQPAYQQLKEWYPIEGVEFPRRVTATADGRTRIDAYPQLCRVHAWALDAQKHYDILISRTATAAAVLDAASSDAGLRAALALPAGASRSALRLSAAAPDRQGALADRLVPLVEPTAVETMARDADLLEMVLECRGDDGSWPRGPWWSMAGQPLPDASPATALSWTKSVGKGTNLDALDKNEATPTWREGTVLEVKQNSAYRPEHGWTPELRVRFRGWASPAWDVKILLSDAAVAPPYSRVRPWRHGVRPGDRVEVLHAGRRPDLPPPPPPLPATADSPRAAPPPPPALPQLEGRWFEAVVAEVDHAHQPPRLACVYTAFAAGTAEAPAVQRVTLSLEDDEALAAYGTHVVAAQRGMAWMELPQGTEVPPAPATPDWVQTRWAVAASAVPPAAAARAGSGSGGSSSAIVPAVRSQYGTRSSSGSSGLVDYGNTDDDEEGAGTSAYGGSSEAAAAGVPASVAGQRGLLQKFLAHYYGQRDPARLQMTVAPGKCGLENLGNTCFMNSMLQCLSNTMELTDYLLSDRYLADINTGNQLGSGGRMAHAYAALVRAMWSGHFSRVAPGPVKAIVGHRAPAFLGWGQQDSQEFASFLLDLLLEDLCRVPVKPVIGDLSSEGKPDAEVAATAWSNFQRRNASVIADIFAGQFKSHVRCCNCERTSITFDPFTSVSVPIPVQQWCATNIFYFGTHNERPVLFVFHYLQGEAPTGQALAGWLAEQIAVMLRTGGGVAAAGGGDDYDADEATAAAAAPAAGSVAMEAEAAPAAAAGAQAAGGAGDAAADAAPGGGDERIGDAYVPKPHELLLTVSTSEPCMVQTVIPHWASVAAAVDGVRLRFGSSGRFNVMAYHVPGSASYAETASWVPSPETDWEPDYEEPAAGDGGDGDGGDDDDYEMGYSSFLYSTKKKAKKPRAMKPHPATPIGPKPSDYIVLWVRRPNANNYGYGPAFIAAADCLVVPTRWLDGRRIEHMTQRQMLTAVWQRLRRLLPPGPQPAVADSSYLVGYFDLNWDKRHLLHRDYGVAVSYSGKIEDSDTPVPHKQPRQWMVDFAKGAKLDLKEAGMSVKHESVQQRPKEASITLEDCLRKFSTQEQLGENDKWYCSACKDHVRAYKKMDIWRLPPVLIVHLKRFANGRSSSFFSSRGGKIDDHVAFPARGLDLTGKVAGPVGDEGAVYDLFAVSEHSGGLGGGHYTAHGFNARDGAWYDFNDSSVYKSTEADATSGSAAYVLFYRRRKAAAGGGAAASLSLAVAPGAHTGGEPEEGEVSAAAPAASAYAGVPRQSSDHSDGAMDTDD